MIEGRNRIGFDVVNADTTAFTAINPQTGVTLEGMFFPAAKQQVDEAMALASTAFPIYKNIAPVKKATFLRAIAQEILAIGDALIERAVAESGLTAGRLQGERGRTMMQLNLFADLVEEGSWVEAIIDSALPDRQPAARPDIRRMLIPMGPVVVFGASNFPLAFSVAGGDTASALAAGCPVVVKAHSAHPGTSALVAAAVVKAAQDTGMPEGVFSMLFDEGYKIGEQLVKHPQTKAVTFTGSYAGGMALNRLSAERAIPVPVFAEMGSINPVLLLPEALNTNAEAIAEQYAGSITLGSGQFCTNPGLLLGVKSSGLDRFMVALEKAITSVQPAPMLTPGIYTNYVSRSSGLLKEEGVEVVTSTSVSEDLINHAAPTLARVSAKDFLANPKLAEEVFGPWSLVVVSDTIEELELVLESAGGQLTVSVMTAEGELLNHPSLLNKATDIAGRVLINGAPTGVEVCAAMQHGGPFPATSDSRFTSVGTMAIKRFVRPVSLQNWAQELLPDALKDENPLHIWRLVDQQFTK